MPISKMPVSSVVARTVLLLLLLLAEVCAGSSPVTIPLRKQDVPVVKNGVTVTHKTSYFGRIFAGNPPQSFTVVFDTGSGHVILPSASCSTAGCVGKRRFERASSKSAEDIEYDGTVINLEAKKRDQLGITFGSGQVQGEFVREDVCLGDGLVRCARMHVVLALKMSEEPFGSFGFDGVLGLGLGSLSLTPEFSFFRGMAMQQNEQQEPLLPQFAVFLSAHDSVASEISFGGHDEARLASPIQWAPVSDVALGYWQIHLRGVRIGGKPLKLCEDGSCRAILDTGTSLLGVPRSEVRIAHRLLARALPEDHGPVDCREQAGPTIVFELDGFDINLTASDYSRMAPTSLEVAGGAPGYRRDFCKASLLPVDLKGPLGPAVFVLGEPVLRRFYTVYDWSKQRVGFGLAVQRAAPDLDMERTVHL